MSIRIVLADDTRMFRDGVQLFLETEADLSVVGLAANGAEALDVVRRVRPDIVLMDIRMPVMDGVEATRLIKAEFPEIQVIILTTYSDDSFLFDTLRAGATGYMVKDLPATELVSAIRAVKEGGVLIPPGMAARLVAEYNRIAAGMTTPQAASTASAALPAAVEAPPGRERIGDLTAREHQILQLVADGLSNKQIAEPLFLSDGTVRNCLSTIFAKLHARDRAQAISLAMRQGLLD